VRRLAVGLLALASLGAAAPGYAPDRPGPDFDVLDYAVILTPNLADASLTGTEVITLASLRDGLEEVAFSGNALEVRAIGGQAATAELRDGQWIIRFKRPLAKGRKAVLKLALSGKPARGWVVAPDHLHTNYFACDWMVCDQDRPGDKATLSLDITTPWDFSALAPGESGDIAMRLGVSVRARHRLAQPYPAYLYGFAVGQFRVVLSEDGRPSVDWTTDRPEITDADLNQTLRDTDAMIAFFQDHAGVSLPARYRQLVVAGSDAQESATYSTLGWDGLSPMLRDPREDWLPAHELAHQWWGNLVTCASWDDFWLNEGITSFMVAAWKEHRWGRAAYDRELALFQARVDKARAAGVDVPLTFHGPYPSLGLKRAIVYSKGALFMDALRREMGEAAFWAGLKRYTRAYAGGAADSHDFQKAMQAETAKPLGLLFDAWVY
jgi:aminopeptidase N